MAEDKGKRQERPDIDPKLVQQVFQSIPTNVLQQAFAPMIDAAIQRRMEEVADQVRRQLEGVPELVQKAVTSQMDQIAASLNQRVSEAVPKGGQGQGEMSPVQQLLLSRLFSGGGGGLESLANMANVLGTVFDKIVLPITHIYTQGRADAHREIYTLSRTNYRFPWEEPPGRPEGRASMSQGREESARDVARRLRLEGNEDASGPACSG